MDVVHLPASGRLGCFACRSEDTGNLTVIPGGGKGGIRLCFRQTVEQDAC